jgi:hypothetical protein
MMASKSSSSDAEEESLQLVELHEEESSIESELHSSEEDLKEQLRDDNSDIDSQTCDEEQSLGMPNTWEDADSYESPLIPDDGCDDSDALSDTLNDDDDDDDSDQGNYRGKESESTHRSMENMFPSFTSSPLSKISERTRETSVSGRTNSMRAGKDYISCRLSSPSGRIRNQIGEIKTFDYFSTLDTTTTSQMAIVEWDDGVGLDMGTVQGLQISGANSDNETDPTK